MFDENGIWHSDTYDQPQTGAAAGLNILNVFKSYGNAQAAQGRQKLKDLSDTATYGEKHGQDLTLTPEGEEAENAVGISHPTSDGHLRQHPAAETESGDRGGAGGQGR